MVNRGTILDAIKDEKSSVASEYLSIIAEVGN
jgi:hypothetical protein